MQSLDHPPIFQGTLEFLRGQGFLAENSIKTPESDHEFPKFMLFFLVP